MGISLVERESELYERFDKKCQYPKQETESVFVCENCQATDFTSKIYTKEQLSKETIFGPAATALFAGPGVVVTTAAPVLGVFGAALAGASWISSRIRTKTEQVDEAGEDVVSCLQCDTCKSIFINEV